ncbi:RNA polymerase sigma factor [Pararhodobacter zhoushanensis]|uniref:RNA polymerase sigma factor n=1 Tax=Pararhodobacter zhoushanensis TaxID=2479545 RepID=A0ABT3H400_9RHOB|nr:RNA polymerase sigma factor [Pararhodobacter zhoushanensis]MCW1934480.1 RNA polymerase sigma factor [Pararhodobacter zhoushanensis]
MANDTPQIDPRDDLVNHLGPMRAFALSLTRNGAEADDLVQEAVMKAWKNIESFQVGTNMQAWLFTILRNTFYSLRRKRSREVSDPDGIAASQLSVKPAHDGRLQLGEFFEAFAKLPVEQREALALVGASGFSYEEAADMCGVAVGTIKSRANRGRARLAELMHTGEEGYADMTDRVTTAIVNSGAQGRLIA